MPTEIEKLIQEGESETLEFKSSFNREVIETLCAFANHKYPAYQARTRNKLIAEAFYLTCDTEKYGSGFRRIRNAIADYPTMQFAYRESGDGFISELLYREQKIQTKTTQETTQETKLRVVQTRVVELLRENPSLTRQELCDILNKSDSTIKEHIAKLKAAGILERLGSTKKGIWKVNKY